MTYSDHNYVEFSIGNKAINSILAARSKARKQASPRWIFKDVDSELLEEVIAWYYSSYKDYGTLDHSAQWIKNTMANASDVVIRRVGCRPRRFAGEIRK